MKRVDPLAKFSIANTSSIDKAEALISSSLTDVSIIKIADRRCFQLQMNGINFGRTSLVFNRYGNDCKIKAERDDILAFVIGSDTPSMFDFDGGSFIATPHKAIMITPGGKMQIQRPRGSKILTLRTNHSDLLHHFEYLTGRHHKGPLIFDHNIDQKMGAGNLLKRTINYLVSVLEYYDIETIGPVLLRYYDELLLTTLISLNLSKWEELNVDHSRFGSLSIVQRAEEYMQAHSEKAITTTDLLRICSCSRSVMFSAFKKNRGYSPMEFLTDQRLQRARQRLLKAHPEVSVSSIALHCGFTHLGRFSHSYRKKFGELPSETLRKGRK